MVNLRSNNRSLSFFGLQFTGAGIFLMLHCVSHNLPDEVFVACTALTSAGTIMYLTAFCRVMFKPKLKL